jgi:membrane associated rhomboid family serine protease
LEFSSLEFEMAWEDRAYYREGSSYGSGPKFIFPMPSKLTFAVIIANVAVFLLRIFPDAYFWSVEHGALDFRGKLAFIQPWRWITYQYIHGGAAHLFFNMISIYFFLPMVERAWGWKRAFAFYTAGGIAAGVAFGFISIFYPGSRLIGASGSIMAVLGAATAIAPDMQILALIIPMTMRTLALLYTVFYILSVVGDRDVSDAAHLGGLAFGFIAVRFGKGIWQNSTRRYERSRVRRRVEQDRAEQEMVDHILEKVSVHGMNSLTRGERKALKKATEHQRERDLEASRRHN